ncbi:MAG: hypothetical protein NTX66_02480, partial [Candidatus Falkowbacteria bacterium]|nr:hypothetical protein [Candidatus Falkowbacteria bacterium]
EYGLSLEIAATLTNEKELANWTEEVISELFAWTKAKGEPVATQDKWLARLAGNWISGELLKHLNSDGQKIKDLKITAENMAELVGLIADGKINSSAGQTILEIMYKKGGDPEDIMKELDLGQNDDNPEIEAVIKAIIKSNPDQLAEYKKGKLNVIQFFIGQVMAQTKGRANPKIARALLEKNLKS